MEKPFVLELVNGNKLPIRDDPDKIMLYRGDKEIYGHDDIFFWHIHTMDGQAHNIPVNAVMNLL